jgi:hypothetical protein
LKTRKYNIWIIKPGENTNRGDGISVCDSLKEIKEMASKIDKENNKSLII